MIPFFFQMVPTRKEYCVKLEPITCTLVQFLETLTNTAFKQ